MIRRRFLRGGLFTLAAMVSGAAWYLHRPVFGKLPTGDRLERIRRSPHYRNGQFVCLQPITRIAKREENLLTVWWKFLFSDKKKLFPSSPIPSRKTAVASIPKEKECVIWLGHSSFYLQLAGVRILIDPVFSPYASPISLINAAFPGSNVYTADDFPEVDVLVISHDHWDHLDFPTVTALRSRVRTTVCPLGVGSYLEQWGIPPDTIREEDWDTEIPISRELSIHILPSQHFSGRMLKPNQTEWAGFAFVTPHRRVFYSGDGGYGAHFESIGKRFGGFDLALLENGQYNKAWPKVHMMPLETALAGVDVRAKAVVPCHSGKFALSHHAWDAPYRELTATSAGKPYRLLTPMIGECVEIGDNSCSFPPWWEGAVAVRC